MRKRLLSLGILTTLLLALPWLAQGAGDYDLSWSAVSTSGGTSVGGPFSLVDSMGSPDAGDPMGGGSFFLASGFVPGAVALVPQSILRHPWPMFRRDWSHRAESPYVGYGVAELQWSFATGGLVYSSPVVSSDGIIYFGSFDGYLYAVNPSGTLKWRFPTGELNHGSPALAADGTIYFGSRSDRVYAITPNGDLKWSYLAGDDVDGAITIGLDGTVYVGSYDNKLYALNPDGSLRWSFTTGGDVHAAPALAPDGTVHVASKDFWLYALNPDGTQKWAYAAGQQISSSPALSAVDGTIYFSSANRLYAIRPDGIENGSTSASQESPLRRWRPTARYTSAPTMWLLACMPFGPTAA